MKFILHYLDTLLFLGLLTLIIGGTWFFIMHHYLPPQLQPLLDWLGELLK